MNPFRNQHHLTDKGWQQMSRHLDQEMPQKERSRRVLAWWLPLLMGLLSSFGLVLFFMEKKIEIRIEDRHPKKVAQIKQNLENQSISSPSTVGNVAQQASPVLTPGLSQYAKAGNSKKTKRSQSAIMPWVNEMDFSPMYIGLGLPNTFPSDHTVPVLLQDQYYELKYGIALSQVSEEKAILPNGHPFSAIESVEEEEIPTIGQQERSPTLTHKAKPSPIHLGLAVLAGTDRFSGLNSAQAGLALDWTPFRHWGIRSGLYYEQFIPSPLARPIAEVDPVQYAIATKNYDFLRFNGGSVPDVAVPVLKLHRVRTPLLLTYTPNKLVRLFGGVSFGYTLYAQAAKRGLVNSNSLVTFRASAENSVSELVTKELPRFNTQGHFGLAFRLNKVELGLYYQQQMGFIEKKSNTLFDANGQYNPRRRYFEDSKPYKLLTVGGTWFF